MGRSMSPVPPSVLARLPASATILDPVRDRHFSVSVQGGRLYQSEWETAGPGKDVFRQTEKVEWIIGAGANGMGGLIRRGDHLFEAPLSFYTKTGAWALSPGYQDADRGFSRPISAACIVCHSGRPNPVRGSDGQFQDPPFDELAIGCENCHGPGEDHVRLIRGEKPAAPSEGVLIVNPAKLDPWLADNICMSCHQTGDARVLQPGKSFRDFRPGRPLDDTLAILMAPPQRQSPPRSDLLQQYFSMRLSQCYRSSGGRLSCIACHDPHFQPSPREAPAYYREKCLACHTEASCTVPLATRRQNDPPDDCAGCHMPKRDAARISHSSLANHRIVVRPDEPLPDIVFHLTTPALPDLVHVDAIPGQPDSAPPLLTLLQAYRQLGVERPEFFPRYLDIGTQLEASEPDNTDVLEALAMRSLQQRSPAGDAAAVQYLNRAIARGSTNPWDFEQLGSWLLGSQRLPEAVACFEKGIQRVPYDDKLYGLLAETYLALNRPRQATGILTQALQLFPQMDSLRTLLNQAEQAVRAGQGDEGPRR
ncbi:MAG: tetratricopeptide repeat protein [Terriglobia bacterium]